MSVQLFWPGKGDDRSPNPGQLQRLETVSPSSAARGEGLEAATGEHPGWVNRLVLGDNQRVMIALLPELRGRVDLVYLDPPFNTGYDFHLPARALESSALQDAPGLELPPPSPTGAAAQGSSRRVYGDRWGKDLSHYLDFLYRRLKLVWELLAPEGSLYLHVDWHAGHYVKILLDEIFGRENFRNEIIWKRDVAGKGAKKGSRQWPRNFDTIFFYTKSESYYFAQPFKPLNEKQQAAYRHRDPDGRRFKAVQLGDYSQASIDRLAAAGLIYVSSTGRRYKKYYLDEAQATVDAIWDDIPGFGTRTAAAEYRDFPTQKPEALLERIISASSRPGDLVADFFAGSGTTLAVAERLGRRWLGVEENPSALKIARQRLLETGWLCTPFEIWTIN